MSDNMNEIVDNLKQVPAWIRIIFMLAFAIVLYIIIAPVIFILMIAQALFSVITGKTNRNLTLLGFALSQYVSQILKFITYNAEEKPFPFSDFPPLDDEVEVDKPKHGDAKRTAPSKTVKKKMSAKKSKVQESKNTDDEGLLPE